MGGTTARKNQDAGIRPLQRFDVIGELLLRGGMRKTVCVFCESPFCAIRVDVSPMETVTALRRIAEIIDFVSTLRSRFTTSGK